MRRTCTQSIQLTLILSLAGSLGACSSGSSTSRKDPQPTQPEYRTQQSAQNTRSQSPQSNGRSNRELKNLAVDELLRLSTNVSPEIRANALEAMQGHTSSLESITALGLSDPNAGVRSVSSMIVGKQKLRALLPMVEGLSNDSSPFVRASALFATAEVQGRRSTVDLTPLGVMLLDSPDIRVSSHAAYVLGELGNESAIPLLQQAWAREWRQTSAIQRQLFRLQLAEGMIKLGDTESMDTVRSALYPSRPEELEATALAVQIIGEVQDRGAIDQLIYLVDEDSERPMPAEVRLAVAGALAKLGLREGGFIADEYFQNLNPIIRAQAAAVYGRTGRLEHLAKLESMMLDESPQVRAGSAGAILEILGTR